MKTKKKSKRAALTAPVRQFPSVTIGHVRIQQMSDPTRVYMAWHDDAGIMSDAGEFKMADLAPVVEKFYADHF